MLKKLVVSMLAFSFCFSFGGNAVMADELNSRLEMSSKVGENLIKNGDFEEPKHSKPGIYYYYDYPGWTITNAPLEIQKLPFNVGYDTYRKEGPNGSKTIAEINSHPYKPAVIYQDFYTLPGSVLEVKFALSARYGAPSDLNLHLGSYYNLQKVQNFKTSSTDWKYFTYQYTVPEGQTITRIQFSSNNAGPNSSNSRGNDIDDVRVKVIKTPEVLKPKVITGYPREITDTSAIIVDNIYRNINPNLVTKVAVQYSSKSHNRFENTVFGYDDKTGSYDVDLKNLSPNTLYYYRAVVYTNQGEFYGDIKCFKTPKICPTPSTICPTQPTPPTTPYPTTSTPTTSVIPTDPTTNPTPTDTTGPTTSPTPTGTTDPTTSPTPTGTTDPTTSPTPTDTTDPTTSPTPTDTTDPTTSPTPTYPTTVEPTSSPTTSVIPTDPTTSPTPTDTTDPTTSPTPTDTTDPTTSPTPTDTTDPTTSPTPTDTTDPTTSPTPTDTTDPTTSPTPTDTTDPTTSPTPTDTTDPTTSPTPTDTTGPTTSPTPTDTTDPTTSPTPTDTTGPTTSPTPTDTTDPTPTTAPTTTPTPTSRFQVCTGNPKNILDTSARIVNNKVTGDTKGLVRVGIEYSTDINFGTYLQKDKAFSDTFNINLKDLKPGTFYFYRAFAIDSNGVKHYGNLNVFYTMSKCC